jgi:hypothetical protein
LLTHYYKILIKFIEKLPFNSYRQRLWRFILKPNITDEYECRTQLEYSGIDILNALGLAVFIVTIFILWDSDYKHFKIIKALNPLFISLSYIIYAIIFSSTISIFSSIASATHWSSNSNTFQLNFYSLFAHCLRCYAAYGLFLGIMFIIALSEIVANGKTPDEVFSNPGWIIFILVTLVWLPFRLLVNPIFMYIKFIHLKLLGWFFVILAIMLASLANQLVPTSIGNKMIDKEELCKIFKAGEMYKEIPPENKDFAVKLMCQ